MKKTEKVPYDSMPRPISGLFLSKEQQEKLKEPFKNMVIIVRCKECKHGTPGACGDGIDCDGVWHNDDWFCADGEPKGD